METKDLKCEVCGGITDAEISEAMTDASAANVELKEKIGQLEQDAKYANTARLAQNKVIVTLRKDKHVLNVKVDDLCDRLEKAEKRAAPVNMEHYKRLAKRLLELTDAAKSINRDSQNLDVSTSNAYALLRELGVI